MTPALLTLNAGSSSLKFGLYAAEGPLVLMAQGEVSGLGVAPEVRIEAAGRAGPILHRLPKGANAADGLALVLAWVEDHRPAVRLVAAGHRVVHGGAQFTAPAPVDAAMLEALEALVPLAPLHLPASLAAIRALRDQAPGLPQLACFDTAFHAGQAARVRDFALPRALTAAGIRRYGFHGLSYAYIAEQLPGLLGAQAEGRVVVAHLGNGASMCGMLGRRSVAATMGFSALDGLPMGTRAGTIDAGVLLHLMETRGMGVKELTDLLYRRSGLLGVSGISSDMRVLLASEAPEAAEAVALFTHRILRELGSLAAAIGGLDALVFTGGIGAHAAPVRAAVCDGAGWLGLTLDDAANRAPGGGARRISVEGARVTVLAMPTDEDVMIARALRAMPMLAAAG